MTLARIPPKVRCRQIGDDDVEAVVVLLTRGFPQRSADYWRKGLQRQRDRAIPDGVPRYGFLLESEGVSVGVILLIFSVTDGKIRANLSSWYVEPAYRIHASMLIFFALKRKDVTYVNISPAPNTWATIEAQGFVRYSSGQFIAMPALKRLQGRAVVHRIGPGRPSPRGAETLPERDILLDHAGLGWTSLLVEAEDGFHPFVFVPFRIRSGRVRLPARQLVFCRGPEDYIRFAGPIGRYLLRQGAIFVVHDANAPEPELLGYFRNPMAPKYSRGPDVPRRGDLAYTERVIFGP